VRPFVLRVAELFRGAGPPESDAFRRSVGAALDSLRAETAAVRPPDRNGKPGGVVRLSREIPTLIVPDIHGRMDFLIRVFGYEPRPGERTLALLAQGGIQVLCLGDGMHAEGRAAARWRAALGEFNDGWRRRENMDEEMRESLGVMAMVMEAKRYFPEHFHFLKGNHENIANESGGGNFPFRKFALEGLMVSDYMRQFYGEEILAEMAAFEKELPLLAVGHGFLASHAEPAELFTEERVIEYRQDADVVAGLTWTDNGEADPDSVPAMLDAYLGEEAQGAYYFGGHRAVEGSYRLRAGGRFVQIHDPSRSVIAFCPPSGEIDLDRDVRDIERPGS
jgi:hypothetical protein